MKGREFENDIFKVLKKINQKSDGFFIKSSTPFRLIPSQSGKQKLIYSDKALCDFVGIIDGKFILIEAKEITGERFELRRLKQHQITQLQMIAFHGGIAIILFKIKNKIVIISIQEYLNLIMIGNKKSININALIKFGKEIDLENLKTEILIF